MAHDVFISYSSTDQPAALAVLHGLESAGIRCWMAPRDIKPGAIWAGAIIEAINGCRVMVVVFSASANRSAHVINEVDAAVRKGAIIVPFRIEDVMPDGAMEFHLRTRHWLDALTPDLEAYTEQLAEQIKMLLAGPNNTSIPTPPPRPMPPDLPPRRKSPPKPAPQPGRAKRIRNLVIAGVVGVALLVFWLTRERPVGNVEFTIHQSSGSGGNQASLKVTTGTLRFFEGGSPMPVLAQRQYVTTFPSGSTRFIYPEVKLTSEAPGRVVSVPISCEIFGPGGEVSGAVTINGQIEPTWTESYSAHGYGSVGGGTWKRGRYRADCRYANSLINRGWFDVVDGTGVTSPPPAPAPATAGTPVQSEPLRSMHARVTNVRVFESPAGFTPMNSRQFETRFSSRTARYINVEVTLNHDAPGRQVTATLTCKYLWDRDSIATVPVRYTIQRDWTATVSVAGWGRATPGYWHGGSYQVVCDDGYGQIGRATFDVY